MNWIERLLVAVFFADFNFLVLSAPASCKQELITTPIDIRERGARTSKISGSRIEYNPFPLKFKLVPGESDSLYLEFRTGLRSGLIFLAANFSKGDMVAAYLSKGLLSFARRCGHGSVKETFWALPLDDLKWHKLRFDHTIRGGLLQVDGYQPFRKYHLGPCGDLNSVHFGGLPPDLNIRQWGLYGNDSRHRFEGCIRQLRFQKRLARVPPDYYWVSQCQYPDYR